uniref:Uncharacterized protein n=1 Tax=Trepomonas sp. PC1 TaxID=1076344 RepID=A0A146KC15_9EUKA|eukprot:JAP93056.1 Hypothetical protein TPC1_14795 [Trepomonas sp. PC1]
MGLISSFIQENSEKLDDQIIKLVIELVIQVKPLTEDLIKHAKFILQHLPLKDQHYLSLQLHQLDESNIYFGHWLCETDAKKKYIEKAAKIPVLVENYLSTEFTDYFFQCLLVENFEVCQKIVSQQQKESFELLFQSVIRENLPAFKLIKSKYSADFTGCEGELQKVMEKFFVVKKSVDVDQMD